MIEQKVDVCVVGAGVAGLACAQGLARKGASVALLDRLDPMPSMLKAEKIEGEAVLALLRLGFQSAVEASLTPLHNVAIFFGERSLGTLHLRVPDGGVLYNVFINSLRANLDPRVRFERGAKVVGLEQYADAVGVLTDKGTRILCKLVVMATGDARQLLEPMGATYETQAPHQVFIAAFTMEGLLGNPAAPDDSQTYHHPVKGGPIAYATFFRLGDSHRANIFCPGPISEEWQRDLKRRPLEAMSEHNHLLAEASKSWQASSPVMIRKLQVAEMRAPAVPRVVALGDAAHTIDPSGGGGLTFALLETEVLLNFYAQRWLQKDELGSVEMESFYNDPRRTAAVQQFFGRGRYILSLNHDRSLRGKWRRQLFFMRTSLDARRGKPANTTQVGSTPWHMDAPYLYEG